MADEKPALSILSFISFGTRIGGVPYMGSIVWPAP
jgi:hypothetical protein